MHVLYQREGNRKGATSSSEQEAPKTPDPKVDITMINFVWCHICCPFMYVVVLDFIIKAELMCGFKTVCTDTEKTCSE